MCLTHRADIVELLATRHTNTNEVGRSAVLGPALTAVAARLGAPLGLVDVGASAGLNLFCDRYRLDYGAAGATGPADAPVRIECAVVGGAPPIAPALPEIAARTGLDLDPVDVRDEDATRWLLACVWPDTGRLPRTRLRAGGGAAGPTADRRRRRGRRCDRSRAGAARRRDAGGDHHVDARLPSAGATRRVPGDVDRGVTRASDRLDQRRGPGVVDRFDGIEPPTDAQGMESSVFGLLTFRAGALDTTELLGFVHPHGGWIDWRA